MQEMDKQGNVQFALHMLVEEHTITFIVKLSLKKENRHEFVLKLLDLDNIY